MKTPDPNEEVYPIGVVSKLTGLPQRYLRVLDQRGVLRPGRSEHNRRLYSENDIRKLRLVCDLGIRRKVNIAGIREIFAILDVLSSSERERILAWLEAEASEQPHAQQERGGGIEAALRERPDLTQELADVEGPSVSVQVE